LNILHPSEQSYYFRHRYNFLLFALLIPFVLHPIAASVDAWGVTLLDISYMVIFFTGVFALSRQRKVAVFALALMLLCQVLTWTNRFLPNKYLILIGTALNCVYLCYTGWVILSRILERKDITYQTIMASLCVYLLIGYVWAFMYSMLQTLDPSAFKINFQLFVNPPPQQHIFAQLYYFFYFSFTTLTTLGFGDILPASSWARVMTALEAMLGQLYLVVLVSRLVSMHIQGSRER